MIHSTLLGSVSGATVCAKFDMSHLGNARCRIQDYGFWSPKKRSPPSRETRAILNPVVSIASASPTDKELLDLIKWHIDRYDRLRSSTSARASALLSANAILFAGVALIANLKIHERATIPAWSKWAFTVFLVVTIAFILVALWRCAGAIAARRTSRSLSIGEIPDRFLFNWGDTLRRVDGCSNFVQRAKELTYAQIVNDGLAELWTDIRQHSNRHRHLRAAISVFQVAVASFLGSAVYAVILINV